MFEVASVSSRSKMFCVVLASLTGEVDLMSTSSDSFIWWLEDGGVDVMFFSCVDVMCCCGGEGGGFDEC